MNRDDALKKIRKCLALGRSASEHEAAAAMRQAQKLMAEHRVTDRELSLVDVQEVRVKARSTAANAWEVRLVHLVAGAFGCEQFAAISGHYNSAGNWVKEQHYVFVGLEAAPNVAGYAYEVLARQCARARLAHIAKQPKNCKPITKSARGDEFAKGWVYGASGTVERFANPERNDQLLLAYLAEKHPDLKKVRARDTGKKLKNNQGHVMAGLRAGENAELNRGVAGRGPQALLGVAP